MARRYGAFGAIMQSNRYGTDLGPGPQGNMRLAAPASQFVAGRDKTWARRRLEERQVQKMGMRTPQYGSFGKVSPTRDCFGPRCAPQLGLAQRYGAAANGGGTAGEKMIMTLGFLITAGLMIGYMTK
jgi:hypothetical protein